MVNFETHVFGKWLLAGEHSVLRGAPALVFPLLSKSLYLKFEKPGHQQSPTDLKVHFEGEHGVEFELLFWGTVERACQLLQIKRSALVGTLFLKSDLPIGAGLGASAALCGGIAKWMTALKFLPVEGQYEFARSLEDLFHGESSGVDISVALSGEPQIFTRNQERTSFKPKWKPKLYLSYSGTRGVTVDCVNRVKALFETQRESALLLDEQMKKSTSLAIEALSIDANQSLPLLIQAIDLAHDCFLQWGLVTHQVQLHLEVLKQGGALSFKPTGSGNGGYVLSLWQNQPPPSLEKVLIPCFV